VAHGSGYTLSLTPQQALLGLENGTSGIALGLGLVGASPFAHAVPLDPLSTHTNYLPGSDPSQWHTNIANYSAVEYQGVYNGIDLLYHGNQGQLEYDFTVAPGADPGTIRLAVQGAEQLSLDADGNLILHTAAGDVIEQAPVIYQDISGARQAVRGRFLLEGHNQVGFQVGPYDSSRPLVIDPTLSYSSYLNGIGYAIAVDGSGDAYVTGYAASNFPTTPGVFQTTGTGIFVAELNATGTALVYATYLGNNGSGFSFNGGYYPSSQTFATGLAVDSAGEAYVTGTTLSGFPTTPNALQTSYTNQSPAAGGNGFFTVLNATGSGLIYSTYLPGAQGGWSGYAEAAIAIDSSGNAYLAGSATAGLPTTAGAFQTTDPNSGDAAFFAEINPHLSGSASLLYSTYLGASGGIGDRATGIAVDGSGNAYVTGVTSSGGIVTTPGAFQTTYGGALYDLFVAKINPALSGPASLVYSTLLGGNGNDGAVSDNPQFLNGPQTGPAIAVDSAGNAYVTGSTASTNFPTTPGAFQTSYHGSSHTITATSGDAFVTKLNATGTGLVYSTYLGGSARDGSSSIAVDASGNAYVTGWTESTDFPTQNPIQAQRASGNDSNGFPNSDVFVTALNASGSGLLSSTYLGGTGDDYGYGLALDSSGNVYVTGGTASSNFPTTAGAYQTTAGQGFVFKMTSPVGPSFALSGFPANITAGTSGTITVTALNPDGSVNTGYNGTVHFTSSDPHAVLPPDTTLTNGTGTFSVTLDSAGMQSITVSDASNPGISGSETGITVSPAAATHFVLSGPTSVSAGTAFSLTVTAVDAYGNVATGYTGTVHFSDSVGGATLPANYTFTASDSGVHTFTGLKLKTKGWPTITVMDTLNNSILGSWTIDVI
jgi:hypothetical protein